MHAYFDFNDHRRRGVVVKVNNKTLWVRLVLGCNTHLLIKRHIDKHNIKLVQEAN